MKNKKQDIAIEKFSKGCNCAQAVLYSFCDDLHLDKDIALKLASGFGGGMGRKQYVCGAISGGIMAIGIKFGHGDQGGKKTVEHSYEKTRELIDRFYSKHNAVMCRELLDGCDLMTEDGQRSFKANDLRKTKCNEYVRSVIEIVSELADKK